MEVSCCRKHLTTTEKVVELIDFSPSEEETAAVKSEIVSTLD